MPAPITHIVLGKKIHQHFFPHLDFPSFIVGTSFPDIRYTSQLTRTQTHLQNIHLKDVDNKNSFLAGFQIHSLIDLIVNKFNQKKISPFLLKTNIKNNFNLKYYQDKILYPEINNWPQIRSFLDCVYPQETNIGVSKKSVQEWHDWLQEYFKKGPVKKPLKMFFENIDQPQLIDKTIKSFEKMERNSRIKKEISYLTENIISLVEKE